MQSKDISENKKAVLYFSGGTMQGVFGAGVATALQEMNIYDHLEAVYGGSGGVLIGSYLLTKQTDIGSSIFWEDLPRQFISKRRFFLGILDRLINRYVRKVPSDKIRDAVDIEYLLKVMQTNKKLDIQTLISQPIPIFAKLFNLDTRTIDYIDLRRQDAINIMRAAVSIFPYMHVIHNIDGHRCIDGAIMDVIGIDRIREAHPESKIIVVLCNPAERKPRYKIKNFLEGKVMEIMFNDASLFDWYAKSEKRLQRELEMCQSDPNIFLIHPPKNFNLLSSTVNPRKLKIAYQMGKDSINPSSILKFIE